MCELQKLSLEAHNQALNTLKDWFKGVVESMEEVEVNKNQEKSKMYISNTPMYMDASSIISACVHSENPDFRWLTKLKIQSDAPILKKLKNDSEQEKKIKKLEKDLLEQRLMYAELQRKMIIQQEEANAREEAQARGYNELKEVMQKQSDMMMQMMEMMKNQDKP